MTELLADARPVAPIDAHSMLLFLLQLGLLLGFALLFGRLALRFNLPAVVGELTAGVLLGPSVLAHAAPGLSAWLLPADANQLHLVDAVGAVGVLLLVGITGVHIDLGLIRRKGATAARVSLGGLLVPLGLGIGLGFVLPAALVAEGSDRTVLALFLGVALCVSAIPVIAKTLLELRLLHRNIGQLIISASAVDDVIGWLLLSVVAALASTGLAPGRVAFSVAALAAVLVLTLVVGRPAVRLTLRLATRSGENAGVPAVVLLLVLAAAGTHALGMEHLLGALLCGMLIGSSGRIDLKALVPLRTLVMTVLAPIYFATAGLRMDLTALARPAVLISAVAVLAVATGGKFAGAYLGARASRLGSWEALALGAGLNARGVIQVVVATVGLRLGVLNTATYTIVVLVAILTSLMAPPLLRLAMRRIAVTREERMRESLFGAAEPRPLLLLVATGLRVYREYLLRSIGTRFRVHLFHTAEPTWEREYLAGWTVLPSTVDGPAMAEAALRLDRSEPVAGVLCWDEGRIHATSYIAAALGLRNGEPDVVWRLRDKAQTRAALAAAGVAQPRSVPVRTLEEALAAAEEIGYPVIIKPRGLGASLGVVRLQDAGELRRLFAFTRDTRPPDPVVYASDHPVLVEECVTGEEISVDSVVRDGQVTALFLARKLVGYPPYAEEVGHYVDAADQLLRDPALRAALQRTHSALGFRDGWTHTEFMLTATGPQLIEVNGRLGGDMIPYLGMLATGIDPGLAAAATACGIAPDLSATHSRVAGVRFFYPAHDDTTIRAISFDAVGLPPAVDRVVTVVQPGAVVSPPPKGAVWDRIAYATALAGSINDCARALDAAEAALRVDHGSSVPLPS